MPNFTFKVGGQDLSQYVRIQPDQGLDPADVDYSTPQFSQSPIREGGVFVLDNVGPREQAWPLFLHANTPAAARDLVQTVNRALDGDSVRVEWKPPGATASTFFDLLRGRWEPAYNTFHDGLGWEAGVLRLWTSPYGDTATDRIVATAIAPTGFAVAATPTGIQGDVAAQPAPIAAVPSGAAAPDGRLNGISARDSSAAFFIPAASMRLVDPAAGLVGASGAPGSQAIQFATAGVTNSQALAEVDLPAAQYAGRQRLMAVVRPAHVDGMAMWARSRERDVPLPTGVATARQGFAALDLGAVAVRESTPTTTVAVGMGAAPRRTAVGQYFTATSARRDQVAGVLVLPEERSVLALDPVERVAGEYFGATGVATTPNAFDDFGNSVDTGDSVDIGGDPGKIASAAWLTPGPGEVGVARTVPGQQIRDGVVVGVGNLLRAGASGFLPPCLGAGIGDGDGNLLIVQAYGMPSPALSLWSFTRSGAVATTTLPLVATTGLTGPNSPVELRFYKQGSQAWANLRLLNATGIGIVAGGATTVPVASIGLVSAEIGQIIGQPLAEAFLPAAATAAASNSFVGLLSWYAERSYAQGAQPGDRVETTATSAQRMRASVPARLDVVGAAPQVGASDQAHGFSLRRDGGPANDGLAVEVRVRERFRFAR